MEFTSAAQVGLRIQLAAELHQRLAIVEAFLVEDAVHSRLDDALQRIEDETRDDDGRNQAPLAADLCSRV